MSYTKHDDNILQSLVTRSRLSWYWLALLVALALLLVLVLAAFLDGSLDRLSDWEFWRQYLGVPVIIAYIFLIYPYMLRLGRNAIDAYCR